MPKFPPGVAGFDLDKPNKPLELTDIAYEARKDHLRTSEEDWQDFHGEPFQCPTCRKHTYTFLEGGDDSPDCDRCWEAGEDLKLPKTSWGVAIPRTSDKISEDKSPTHTRMDVKTYSNHSWGSILKNTPNISDNLGIDTGQIENTKDNFPKGPYSCAEKDETTGNRRICGMKFNNIEDLADHWTHDVEHHDAWGKD